MSRIYHNDALSSLPVNQIDWQGTCWVAANYQKGPGTLVEGTVVNRSRHVITDRSKSKTRYLLLHVKVRRAHRRAFKDGGGGGGGVEVEPNYSDTQKVWTGYLHSSYKTTPKGQTDALGFKELAELVQPPELSGVVAEERYHRQQPGCLSFWLEEKQVEGVEVNDGDEVRLKTKGNGPFVESFVRLDAESGVVSNYANRDNVGASWTDKVMAFKATKEDAAVAGDDQSKANEGAADDEWGD